MAKLKLDFKKIDLTGVKQFFIARGEKVALGLFAALGFFLIVVGLYAAVNSNVTKDGKSSFTIALSDKAAKLEEAMRSTGNIVAPPGGGFSANWTLYRSYFPFLPMIPINDDPPPKCLDPEVMPVPTAEGSMQIDYIKGAALVYELVKDEETVWIVAPADAKNDKENNNKIGFHKNPAGGRANATRLVEILRPKSARRLYPPCSR